MNEENQEIVTLKVDNEKVTSESKFIFNVDYDIWLLEISQKGIKFNREVFPNSGADDFADAFLRILEKEIDVKFTRKLERKGE